MSAATARPALPRSWVRRPLAAAIAALAAAPVASASERPPAEEPFFEELRVISGSRLPQHIADVPGAVTVFDRDFIRATGYRDISRLLRLAPGYQVVNDRGHSPLITYDGLGGDYSNRMQVLIDGRSVYSPSLVGGTDWSGMPLTIDEIERIEVLRGSNSAAYGSNAFLGVINIVTRDTRLEQGNATLATRAGERGLLDVGARLGAADQDRGVRMNVQRLSDRGYERLEDNQRLDIFTLRGDVRLTARDDVTLWAGMNNGKRINGFPGSFDNGLRTLTSHNRFAHVRWNRTYSTDSELSAGLYRNDETIYEPLSIPGIDVDRQSTRDNLDFQHTYAASRALRIVWGGETRRDRVQSRTAFFPGGEATSRLYRGFANAEWRPFTSLVVNAGGMEEKYAGKAPRLAPRLFGNWTVTPGQTLRAGWTRAYREPSLFEERGDLRLFSGATLLQVYQFGPGALRPERILSREIGWVAQYAPWRLTTDVRAYQENVADLIETQSVSAPAGSGALDPRSRVYYNVGERAQIRGLEAQVKARPRSSTDLLVGGAMVRINSQKLEFNNTAPKVTWNATWIERYAYGFSTTLTFAKVGSYRWIGSQPVDNYHYYDARLAREFRIGATRLEIAGGVQDFGPHREEFQLGASYTPRQPISRLYYLSARVDL